jgi:hypothetical protein
MYTDTEGSAYASGTVNAEFVAHAENRIAGKPGLAGPADSAPAEASFEIELVAEPGPVETLVEAEDLLALDEHLRQKYG